MGENTFHTHNWQIIDIQNISMSPWYQNLTKALKKNYRKISLTNTHANILNKILANQIYKYIKETYVMTSCQLIYHMYRIRKKYCMCTSIHTLIKNSEQFRNKGNFLNLLKFSIKKKQQICLVLLYWMHSTLDWKQKDVKLSLFMYNIVVYVESAKESTNNC